MKRSTSLLLILTAQLMSFSGFATHNRGGIISYQHIGGLTYQFTITTSTVPDSPADRPELQLNLGDGNLDTVPRVNGGGVGELITNGLKLNKYVTTHTYQSNGSYVLSVEDPNRNPGIINIPNSVDVPFYIESLLVIGGTLNTNSSVVPLSPSVFDAVLGEPYVSTLPVQDIDADNLTFELIDCKGANGQDITGYTLPANVQISELSGEFVWPDPDQLGTFSFAVKINEWRDGVIIGYSIYDYQIEVHPGFGTGEFELSIAWPTDQAANPAYVVGPDSTVEFEIGFSNFDADSVQLELITEWPGTFQPTVETLNSIENSFSWTATMSHVRCAPYIFVFRGTDYVDGHAFNRDTTLMIYAWHVSDSSFAEGCNNQVSILEMRGRKIGIEVYPNPTNDKLNVSVSLPTTDAVTVEIYDQFGKRLMTKTEQESTYRHSVKFDVSELARGVYTLCVLSSTGRKSTKFIKSE